MCIRDRSSYLEDEFIPFWEVIKKETVRKAEDLDINVNDDIQRSERTLSASDFGFHNVIKREDGRLFFVDLEYYGWDDPVKVIADFYLQPAVPVPLEFRESFFKKVRRNYCEGSGLEKRLSIVYPILGLKWCLIMLNKFLHIEDGGIDEATSLEYLGRSKNKLKEVRDEVAANVFPIGYAHAA